MFFSITQADPSITLLSIHDIIILVALPFLMISSGSIRISVMLSSQMIIAGVRHSPYSSKPPTHHHPTHKDSDLLFFSFNALITEIRMLTFHLVFFMRGI
jgi:hypothetical protein